MEAEIKRMEFSVECPVCAQSFIVEAPPEPVRVQATVVPGPVFVERQVRHNATHSHPQPRRKDLARREEARAKLAIGAMLVGGPLVLGGMIWAVVSMKEAAEKKRAEQWNAPAGRGEFADSGAHVKEALARKLREDAEAGARLETEKKAWRDAQVQEEQMKAGQRRALIRSFLARDVFQGDEAMADEAAREFEEAERQVMGRYSDGIPFNEPADPVGEMQKIFLARLLGNQKIMNWAQGRSIQDYARRIINGRMRGPDGNLLAEDSIQHMLLSGKYTSTGSAFWVSRDGWLLTNAHVTGTASSVDLRTPAGRIIRARVVKSDKEKDLSLLKAETTSSVWLPITGGEPRVGLKIVAAGFPRPLIQGVECKITSGDINSLSGAMDNRDHLQCSVPVFPGNSGGPVLETASGWVVGVITSQIVSRGGGGDAGNVSYAIKASVVRTFVASVPEACPLLEKTAAPKNANGFDESIARASLAAVLVLVK